MPTPENKAPVPTHRPALLAGLGQKVVQKWAAGDKPVDDGFKRASTPAPPPKR